jgi:integrase
VEAWNRVNCRVTTFRLLWNSAKAWGYVTHDPCEGLILPDWDKPEQPAFDVAAVQRIMAKAKPPYDTVFWMLFETGIRRGEVCALNVGHVDLHNRLIVVRHSRWNQHITDNKSRKPRVFSLSPQLTERLRSFVEHRKADQPLFVTAKGRRLNPDNFVKRKLKPVLKALGLQGGCHAFRHGNATTLDGLNVSLKIRQERAMSIREQRSVTPTS